MLLNPFAHSTLCYHRCMALIFDTPACCDYVTMSSHSLLLPGPLPSLHRAPSQKVEKMHHHPSSTSPSLGWDGTVASLYVPPSPWDATRGWLPCFHKQCQSTAITTATICTASFLHLPRPWPWRPPSQQQTQNVKTRVNIDSHEYLFSLGFRRRGHLGFSQHQQVHRGEDPRLPAPGQMQRRLEQHFVHIHHALRSDP